MYHVKFIMLTCPQDLFRTISEKIIKEVAHRKHWEDNKKKKTRDFQEATIP